MTPKARPGTTETTFREFDWTGLTAQSTYQLFGDLNIYSGGDFTNLYGGMEYYTGFYYDFGYEYDTTWAALIQMTGTSTYKWQWLVPSALDANGVETGVPDYANFPVPTLFMLGRIDSGIRAYLIGQKNGDTWADGQLLDQWNTASKQVLPATQQFYSRVPPSQFVANDFTRDAGLGTIRTTPTTADKTILQGLLQPTSYVEGYSTGQFVRASDIELLLTCQEHAFALELSDTKATSRATNGGATTLDLFGYADKRGDGKNQFVYGTDSLLYIPMGVKLKGAPNDVDLRDTNWAARQKAVDWKIDINTTSTMSSVATTQWPYNILNSLFDPTIDPSLVVAQTTLFDSSSFNGFVYSGLPQNNADFGNHLVTLMVKDTINKNKPVATEIAHIQTYFKGTDTTHYTPQGFGVTPNWWWYYTQRYIPLNTTYNPSLEVAGRYYTINGNIEISPLAFAATSGRFHVYALRGSPSVVSWIGDLDLKGLLAYIFVAAHEQGHRILNNTKTGLRPNTYISMTPPISINGVLNDANSDGVDDAWAAAHHMGAKNPMDPNSSTENVTGIRSILNSDNDAGKENSEALADILALGVLKTMQNEWRNDWAKEGTQFGLRPPNANAPTRFLSWTFYPRVKYTQDIDPTKGTETLPADCLIALP